MDRTKTKVFPSSVYQKLKSKKIIKILCTTSQSVALAVPDLFDYSGLTVIFIIHSSLICLGLSSLGFYTLYHKLIDFHSRVLPTAAVLDIIVIAGSTVTNIISIVFAVIFRRKKIVRVAEKLKNIERLLNEKFEIVRQFEDRGLLVQFGCLEACLLSYVTYDSVCQVRENGAYRYTLAIISHLNLFMVSLTVMQVILMSTILKHFFVILNEKLKSARGEDPKNSPLEMKFYLIMYGELCDVIDLVSRSYGIQIAFIVFIIIICLIQSMNLIMKFALNIEKLPVQWRVSLLFAYLWASIIYIVFGLLVAICCEQTSSQTDNTSMICYKILLGYPSCPKNHHDEVTKNELILLAEHLSQRKVKFTAAGLFAIDYTMLYMIFGSIAAYLVIVLQFQ